jgi:hypothetical protein
MDEPLPTPVPAPLPAAAGRGAGTGVGRPRVDAAATRIPSGKRCCPTMSTARQAPSTPVTPTVRTASASFQPKATVSLQPREGGTR